MKKHNTTTHDINKANDIKYFKSCKNCPYIKVNCVSAEEEIYRWECFNGNYVDLHSWEKPYPYDFGYNGDCGIIIAQSEGGKEMKTREEQIKEMAQCMCGAKDSDICQNSCSKACGVWKYAERAITAGYRKQNDPVREFVEKIEEVALQMRYEASRVYQGRNQSEARFAFGEKNAIENLMEQINALAAEYSAEVEE